jgi:precorrin-2 dehydrogenase/sirohydrochlorin ferrochelatase
MCPYRFAAAKWNVVAGFGTIPRPVRLGYPIMLDVSRRLSVIVGGGQVAARKARGLLDAGATRVRVVSPTFCDEMPAGVERVEGPFEPRHLDGAALVFAATARPDVNAAVIAEARRVGALVSRADADADEPGDFATPATARQGDLMLTVSTGGAPALAALVRDRLVNQVDPAWPAMAAAMKALRPRVLASGWPIERRRDAFRTLATDQAFEVLRAGGMEGVWEWLVRAQA